MADLATTVGVKIPERRHLRVVQPEETTPPAPKRIEPDTSTFDDFIGNTDAVIRILMLLEKAEESGAIVYPHLLLHGPFGVGKTKIAHAIAKRRGTELHAVDDAKTLRNARALQALMGKVSEGDVVFIDELHRLRNNEEALYTLMDTGETTVLAGSGRDSTISTIRVPPFTLIGATTSPGALSRPFRSRFIPVELSNYTDDEISRILRAEASRRGVEVTDDGADRLALLARGTARLAVVELIELAEATAYTIAKSQADGEGARPVPVIDVDCVESMMLAYGIDQLGLKGEERGLLRALCDPLGMGGGPIGALKLAGAVGMEIEDVRDLEQFLFKAGLMWFDGRGRKATVQAYRHLTDTDDEGRVWKPPPHVVGWSRDRGLLTPELETWLRSLR